MTKIRSFVIGLVSATALSGAAMAADLGDFSDPYTPYSSGFGFEGFYAGVIGGGIWDGTSSYLIAPDTAAFSLGVAAGVNFYITDDVVGGFEFQGTANFGASGTTLDGLALGRLGYAPSDDVMIYAAAGPGLAAGAGIYAVGGGIEYAATDNIGVRAELLGVGAWGTLPDAAKASVGLLWHMD